MKRNTHTFQFSGDDIAKAAHAEWQYHDERIQHWSGRQVAAAAKAKEAGIEIREIPVTGGKRVDVVLNPTVQDELQLCTNKIAYHRAAADRFGIESDAYGTQPDRVFELDADDVYYFRLAGGPREE